MAPFAIRPNKNIALWDAAPQLLPPPPPTRHPHSRMSRLGLTVGWRSSIQHQNGMEIRLRIKLTALYKRFLNLRCKSKSALLIFTSCPFGQCRTSHIAQLRSSQSWRPPGHRRHTLAFRIGGSGKPSRTNGFHFFSRSVSLLVTSAWLLSVSDLHGVPLAQKSQGCSLKAERKTTALRQAVRSRHALACAIVMLFHVTCPMHAPSITLPISSLKPLS